MIVVEELAFFFHWLFTGIRISNASGGEVK